MNDRTLGNASADEGGGLALSAKHGRNRIAAAFANYHYDLPLTVLIAGITAVTAVVFLICWLHIAAKITTINLSDLAFTVIADRNGTPAAPGAIR